MPRVDRQNFLTIVTDKGEKSQTVSVRPPVALAIVNLLMKLPIATREQKLPQLLTKLTWVLRDRHQSSRDGARVVLGQVAQTLGSKYVHDIVKEMKGGLTRGYQLHVLGYTVHHVLQGLAAEPGLMTVGSIDDAIPTLVEIFIDDCFGDVAEQKDIAQVAAKLMEAKKRVSFDSFSIVAKVASAPAVEGMLEPLRVAMATTESMSTVKKIEDILRNIAVGLNNNPGLPTSAILNLSETLVGENHELSMRGKQVLAKSALEKRRPQSIYVLPGTADRSKTPESCFNTNAHLLVEMGLGLFATLLRRNRISRGMLGPGGCGPKDLGGAAADRCDLESEGAVSEAPESRVDEASVDRFVPLLADCLHSKFNKVIDLALRALSGLLKFGEALPTLKETMPHISQRVFKLMRRSGSSQSALELNQACFKIAAIMVRDCPWHPVNENQAKVLVSYAQADLETSGKQNMAFGVLKAVVTRKVVIAEVYDVLDRVAEMMVQAPSAAVRELARTVMLPFLLDYPLGRKRLAKSLNFLISNLEYPLDGGRESVLTMLQSVVVKFPDQVIDEYCGLFFVALVKLVVNSKTPRLRSLAADVLQQLVGQAPPPAQDKMHEMAVAWLSERLPALRRGAVQVISMFVDALGKGYSRFVPTVEPVLGGIVTAAVQDGMGLAADDAVDTDEPESQMKKQPWMLLYTALLAMNKLFEHFPAVLDRSSATGTVWCLAG